MVTSICTSMVTLGCTWLYVGMSVSSIAMRMSLLVLAITLPSSNIVLWSILPNVCYYSLNVLIVLQSVIFFCFCLSSCNALLYFAVLSLRSSLGCYHAMPSVDWHHSKEAQLGAALWTEFDIHDILLLSVSYMKVIINLIEQPKLFHRNTAVVS